MAINHTYIIECILAMALATVICRAFPFVFSETFKNNPQLQALGDFLPPVIIALLVMYCFQWALLNPGQSSSLELGAGVGVAILHCWKRNALMSIFLGTGVYLFLVNYL